MNGDRYVHSGEALPFLDSDDRVLDRLADVGQRPQIAPNTYDAARYIRAMLAGDVERMYAILRGGSALHLFGGAVLLAVVYGQQRFGESFVAHLELLAAGLDGDLPASRRFRAVGEDDPP